MDRRLWYRLHWITWVVIVAVAAALIRVQWLACSSDDAWSIWFGWPLIAYEEDEGLKIEGSRFHAWGLVGNLTIACVACLASAFTIERWLSRQPPRLQFSVQSLLIATIIAGVMLTFVRLEATYFEQTRNPAHVLNSYDASRSVVAGWPSTMLDRYPWSISLPLLFSVACMLYTAGWLLARISRLTRRVFDRSHAKVGE
jgi:hypothetical protein